MNQFFKYAATIFGLAMTFVSGGSLSVSNSKGFSSNPLVDKTGTVLTSTDSVIVTIGTFASAPATAMPGSAAVITESAYQGLLAEFTPYGTPTSLLPSAAPLNLKGVFSFQDRVTIAGTPLAGKPVYLIVARGTSFATATEVTILKTSSVFDTADDDNPFPRLVGVGTDLGTVAIVGSATRFTAVATSLDESPQAAFSLAKVGAVGVAPTDLALSSDEVLENVPGETLVGNLSASDADEGESFFYNLVTGSGDTDNGKFSINGNQLLTGEIFDHETQQTAAIRVRVVDSSGLEFEKSLTVTITDDRSEDFDEDGLTEAQEEDTHGTSDTNSDSDADGFKDGFEVAHGLNPNSNLDGTGDRDGDGWVDWLEVRLGTNADVSGPGLDFAVSKNDAGNPLVRVGPGGILLGFCVERSEPLSGSWLKVADFPLGLPPGETVEWTDDASPDKHAFYRIGTYLLPATD